MGDLPRSLKSSPSGLGDLESMATPSGLSMDFLGEDVMTRTQPILTHRRHEFELIRRQSARKIPHPASYKELSSDEQDGEQSLPMETESTRENSGNMATMNQVQDIQVESSFHQRPNSVQKSEFPGPIQTNFTQQEMTAYQPVPSQFSPLHESTTSQRWPFYEYPSPPPPCQSFLQNHKNFPYSPIPISDGIHLPWRDTAYQAQDAPFPAGPQAPPTSHPSTSTRTTSTSLANIVPYLITHFAPPQPHFRPLLLPLPRYPPPLPSQHLVDPMHHFVPPFSTSFFPRCTSNDEDENCELAISDDDADGDAADLHINQKRRKKNTHTKRLRKRAGDTNTRSLEVRKRKRGRPRKDAVLGSCSHGVR